MPLGPLKGFRLEAMTALNGPTLVLSRRRFAFFRFVVRAAAALRTAPPSSSSSPICSTWPSFCSSVSHLLDEADNMIRIKIYDEVRR